MRVCTTASALSSTRIPSFHPSAAASSSRGGLPRNTCTCSCSSERARAGIWPSRPFPFSLHNASVYGPKRMESGGEAQRARSMENDAIVDGSSGPSNIFISGAAGPNAALINGHYVSTQETGLDGRTLYLKCDQSVCIEHRRKLYCSDLRICTQGVWQVKHVSSKGTDQCLAGVEGGCALEACVSRV